MGGADIIHIRDLEAECVIGTMPDERLRKQKVVFNIAICCDMAKSGRTDDIADTVDYKEIKDEILEFAAGSEFFLLERLATSVADICLRTKAVKNVTVVVDKPGALTGARSVAVEITRSGQE